MDTNNNNHTDIAKPLYIPQNGPEIEKEEEPPVREQAHYRHANLLAHDFRGKWRYAHHSGMWMAWTGKYWEEVSEREICAQAMNHLTDTYIDDLKNAPRDEFKDCFNDYKSASKKDNVAAAVYILSGFPGFSTHKEEWDSYPWLLNVENGILDLKTTTLKLHNPEYLLTKMVNAPFEPAAFGPLWESHIKMCLPDEEVRRQVQRDLGISLVGEVNQERLTIWYGSGANGKTTTQNVIEHVLGGYVQAAAPDLLIAKDHENHPTEMADLFNIRLLFASEVGTTAARLNEPKVKKLTGGDKIKARYMRRDFFEFRPSHDLIMTTNAKPVIEGADMGIWRRICLIPWDTSIPIDEQRPQGEIVKELLEDRSAILSWLLEGLRDWLQAPKWLSERVRADTEEYRDTQDRVSVFLRERCDTVPLGRAHLSNKRVSRTELYNNYTDWAAANEEQPLDKIQFGKRLSAMGYRNKRTKEGGKETAKWLGISILTPEEQEEREAVASKKTVSYTKEYRLDDDKNGIIDGKTVLSENVRFPYPDRKTVYSGVQEPLFRHRKHFQGTNGEPYTLLYTNSDTGPPNLSPKSVVERLEDNFLPYEQDNRLDLRLFYNPNKELFRDILRKYNPTLEDAREWIRKASDRGDLAPFYYDVIEDAIRRRN